MKKVKCKSDQRLIAGIIMLFMILLVSFVIVFSILIFDTNQLVISIIFLIFNCVFFPTMTYLAFRLIAPCFFSTLIISKDHIVWKCPLHKNIQMDIDQCIHVGVEDSLKNLWYYRSILNSNGRGDEFRFIYLSTYPLPQKYIHKANSARSQENFIIFPYTDKACLDLIEVLPKHRTFQLVSFYNSLQLADQKRAKDKKNKKEKKKTNKKK